MNGLPPARADLNALMDALEVNFLRLTECVVSPGWRLSIQATDIPAIHYNITGIGRMIVGDHPPIILMPHTLVVVPPGRSFSLEVPAERASAILTKVVEARPQTSAPGALRRLVAGESAAPLLMICGYFRASYGTSIDLFGALTSVIVEQFDTTDQLDQRLKSALAELVAQEVGMGAMTTSLMKQVLVTLLRRSVSSATLWVGQLPVLGDPQVARALSEMVAKPGAAHSVMSLAQTAGLSRSAFMARFAAMLGTAPMTVLRDLRMRQAAILLNADSLTVDQVAHDVGYDSRSGFLRAFRKVYGSDPSDWRAAQRGVTV